MITLWGANGGLNALLGSAAFVPNFSNGSVLLLRGSGAASFTRATPAGIPWDWEGKPRDALSGEVRFPGMRRVYNQIPAPTEDFANALWTPFTSGTGAAVRASTYAASVVGGAGRVFTTVPAVSAALGDVLVFSVLLSGVTGSITGTSAFTINGGTGSFTSDAPTAALMTNGRVSIRVVCTAAGTFRIRFGLGTPGDQLTDATATFSRPQVENVTGQSNQNPGEYVSVGVLAAPYHGAAVDGVKYFAYTNGNTVTSNVVTEAVGTLIPKSGLGVLRLPGVAGSFASTPDAPANTFTTTLAFEAYLSLDDWTPGGTHEIVSKNNTDASDFAYLWRINPAGTMTFYGSENGAALINCGSIAITPPDGTGLYLRVEMTTGATFKTVRFYQSQDGVTWVQIGVDQVMGTAAPLFASTMSMKIGARGITGSGGPMLATIRRFKAFNTVALGALPVVDMNPTAWTSGATFPGGAGETWTLNGGAAIRKWPRGYLPEEATTNIVLQSEDFSHASWSKVGTPVTTSAAKRCGNLVLDLLSDDDAAVLEYYYQNIAFTADAVKAPSFYFAQGSSTSSRVDIYDATLAAFRVTAVITWTNGLPTVTMTTGTLLGVDYMGDGVFRARIASTSVTVANTNQYRFYPATDITGTATSTGTAYFGAAQAENKTFCTSYVKTTTAAVTRNADVLTYPYATATGSANTAQVKAFNPIDPAPAGASDSILAFSDGSANERVQILFSPAHNARLFVSDGGVTQADIIAANLTTAGASAKVAVRWALNDFAVATNGGSPDAGVLGTIPDTTTLYIGMGATGGAQLNALIQDVRIWTRALTDAELRAVTA